jgi:hypothetical protein
MTSSTETSHPSATRPGLGRAAVSEDAKVLSVPLADPVGPPVQIGIAVQAGVEVIMVRAVEPHVNRCRGGSQDTGQACATHHHIGCVVAAQQVEDGIDGPAVVAELDGDTHPSGRPRKK